MKWLVILFWLMTGCSDPEPVEPEIDGRALTTEVAGPAMSRVDILNADGLVIETQRAAPPKRRIQMAVGWADGASSVRIHSASSLSDHPIPDATEKGSFELYIDAPLGQGPVRASNGGTHPLSLVEGTIAQVALVIQIVEPGDYAVQLGTDVTQHRGLARGARLNLMGQIDQDTQVSVSRSDGTGMLVFELKVDPITSTELRNTLRLVDTPFPVDSRGEPEIDREPNRVTLPAPWWKELLKRTALGTRNWDRYEPWANQGVQLHNSSDQAINVAIRTVVTRTDGTPDPAFRPRFRDIDESTQNTRALLRIPPKRTATAVLPVYVDENELGTVFPTDGWRRRIEITPLGIDTPIVVATPPLYVSRASTLTTSAVLFSVLAAFTGWGWVAFRWRRWVGDRATTRLMVVAMLGAMMFTVGAGGQLVGMGIGAVLGPFSSMFTGLIDDAFRTALMLTLLVLYPRTGTATLAILVEALLGALTLGQVGPLQLLIVGNRLVWTELFLWLAGVTRGPSWVSGHRWVAWIRVGLALGITNVVTSGLGLVMAAVFYRLYYAEWYVWMILAGPSFGYVLLGCAIAMPFARSLRAVSP